MAEDTAIDTTANINIRPWQLKMTLFFLSLMLGAGHKLRHPFWGLLRPSPTPSVIFWISPMLDDVIYERNK